MLTHTTRWSLPPGNAVVPSGWQATASPSYARLALAAGVLVLLAALAGQSPLFLLGVLLAWLTGLGLVRRLATTIGSAGSLGDPLLLVAPAAWLLLAAVAVSRGALRERTPMTTTVLVLTMLLTVSSVNPLQGGLVVGLSGLMLVVPPMLAFWVGRSLVDDRSLRRVLLLVAVLAAPAAAYGLYQTYDGFPSWDQSWITSSGYAALDVGGVLRAFSSFSSAAEYATFIAIGIVLWVALARKASQIPIALGASALLAVALWLESSRGIVVFTFVAVVLTTAARRGVSLRLASVLVVTAVLAVPWFVGKIAPSPTGTGTTGVLVSHQVQGLADPFGATSTLPGHVARVTDGISQAFANPLGRGVGAVTLSASKYGATASGTEADPGNVAVAIGLPGLVAYIVLVVLGFARAYRGAASRRDWLSLAALGLITVTLLQWFNGAMYAVAPVPWLILGWLDRPTSPTSRLGEQQGTTDCSVRSRMDN